MIKNVMMFIILTCSIFGQDRLIFREFFNKSFIDSQRNLLELEESIAKRDEAFLNLNIELKKPAPLNIEKAYELFSRTSMRTKTLVEICSRGEGYLLSTTNNAFNYKEISPNQASEAHKLAVKMGRLAKSGEPKPEQIAIHKKVLEYAYKDGERTIKNMRESINSRKKASQKLAKKIGGDKVKIKVYADRMMKAHEKVVLISKNNRAIAGILWYAEYTFKDGYIKEKQYDRAKQLAIKLKDSHLMRWASKNELEIYKQAMGSDGAVEMIMK